MSKPTPAQIRVLTELAKPDALAYYMPYMGTFSDAYWFLNTNHKRCTAQINALRNRGLVQIFSGGKYERGVTARISESGRAALAAAEVSA